MIKKIVNNEFSEVKESKIALVDFSATWCNPCKMLEPVLEEISEEMGDKVAFFNADTDANMQLSMEYKIQSIPALIVFKDGEPVESMVGFRPKESIVQFIEKHL